LLAEQPSIQGANTSHRGIDLQPINWYRAWKIIFIKNQEEFIAHFQEHFSVITSIGRHDRPHFLPNKFQNQHENQIVIPTAFRIINISFRTID
jgi:hypothetical protein